MFLVLEVQDNRTEVSTNAFTFTKQNDALEKYYEVLAEAAQSEIAFHGASLYSNGYLMKTDMVDHFSINSFPDIDDEDLSPTSQEPETIPEEIITTPEEPSTGNEEESEEVITPLEETSTEEGENE